MNAQLKPKGRQVKLNKSAVIEGGEVTLLLNYSDGTGNSYRLPPELHLRAAAHGALDKLGKLVSQTETLAGLKDAISAQFEQWNGYRWAGRGSSQRGTSVVQKALMEHTGKSADEVRAFLKGKTMKQKNDIKRLPGVADIVARLEYEGEVEAEGLLDGLV